ncbi:MAG: hypothetical protein KUG78_09890 [Kangiellaceae bacterium]|nr:hypothetical protein [Kangiellaceae bacterium]
MNSIKLATVTILILLFSVCNANAAKENHDRSKSRFNHQSPNSNACVCTKKKVCPKIKPKSSISLKPDSIGSKASVEVQKETCSLPVGHTVGILESGNSQATPLKGSTKVCTSSSKRKVKEHRISCCCDHL